MTNQRTKKVLTLLGFVILVFGFIAFKSGAFDESEQRDNLSFNRLPGSSNTIAVDSPGIDTGATSPHMIPSSKSIMMIDHKVIIKKDTVKPKIKKK